MVGIKKHAHPTRTEEKLVHGSFFGDEAVALRHRKVAREEEVQCAVVILKLNSVFALEGENRALFDIDAAAVQLACQHFDVVRPQIEFGDKHQKSIFAGNAIVARVRQVGARLLRKNNGFFEFSKIAKRRPNGKGYSAVEVMLGQGAPYADW